MRPSGAGLGNMSGLADKFPPGQLPPRGELVRSGTCPGGTCPGGSCPGGTCLLALKK